MHRNLLNTIMIDVPSADVERTVTFWAAALGATPLATAAANYHILGNAADPNRLGVQDVGTGPARVHFDIHTDDLDAEIERLRGLGATLVDSRGADHPARWVVMRDPAGLEFCIVWALNEIRPQSVRDDFERRAKPVG
jgi:predicted enzyme related to lactoylglutathione lyase